MSFIVDIVAAPAFVLTLLAVLVGVVRLRPGTPGWRPTVDIPAALLLGLGAALLGDRVLADHHLTQGHWLWPDDSMVCATLWWHRAGQASQDVRQPLAGWIAALLSGGMGTMPGLAAAALLGRTLYGAALYTAGRLLHSPAAGVAAVALSLAFTPLVLGTRHLTLYSLATAFVFSGTVLGLAALTRPGWRGALLAGTGAGLALAADFTGLTVSLPILAVGLVCALRGPQRGRSLALLVLPVLLSFGLARLLTPPEMSSLERETRVYIYDTQTALPMWAVPPWSTPPDATEHTGEPLPRLRTVRSQPTQLPDVAWSMLPDPRMPGSDLGYRWGHTGPREMARSVATMALLSRAGRAFDQPNDEDNIWLARKVGVAPLVPVGAVALLLALLTLRRRPWVAVGLLALLVPYIGTFGFHLRTHLPVRYLMGPLGPLPLVLALGLLVGASSTETSPRRQLLSAFGVGVVLLVLVLGLGGTWLAPDASWRVRVPDTLDAGSMQLMRAPGWRTGDATWDGHGQTCVALFADDVQHGKDPLGGVISLEAPR